MHRAIWHLLDPALAPRDGDLSGYLQQVLDLCMGAFRATGGSLFVRESHDVFRLACSTGRQREMPSDAAVTRGQGIAGLCLSEDRPMRINNPAKASQLAGRVSVREDLVSSLVIPLSLPDGHQVGLLNLSRQLGQPIYRSSDLDRASRIGSQIALVIGNAQRMAETRQAHQELQVLFGRLPYAVWLYDAKGNLRESNATACALGSGLPPAWEVPHGFGTWEIRDAKHHRWWRVNRSRAGEATLVTAEDVTDLKDRVREEARLRRLAEIGQMTATLAHEIRNPLTGIRTAAQMIESCPEQQQEFAQIIQEEADKLNGLCQDLLDFARPLSLRLAPSPLSDIAQRVVDLEREPLRSRGVALSVESQSELNPVQVDATRMEQVVRNLVLNAADACKPGGQVRVEVAERLIVVTDNGDGMDLATQEKLFTPFFTTKVKGTGLGLSYARKVIEAHGGAITIKSSLGEGTTVSVSLEEAA